MLRRLPLPFVLVCAVLAALTTRPAAAATITVNTGADTMADDAVCSLREAVLSANADTAVGGCAAGSGADEIVVPATGCTLALKADGTEGLGEIEDLGLTGDLDITGDVTIRSSGTGTAVIQWPWAEFHDRLIDVRSGSVVLRGLHLRHGLPLYRPVPQDGAGIRNAGTLRVESCTFSRNRAGNGVSSSADRSGGNGGGIYSTGPVTIVGSTFLSNGAGFPGGSDAPGGVGGAIAVVGAALTIEDTTFEENRTEGISSSGRQSGTGGAVSVVDGTLTVRNCTFTANETRTRMPTTDTPNHGGAIYLSATGPSVIENSTFTANYGQLGGAVFATAASRQSLAVTNSTFDANTSTVRGSAIVGQGALDVVVTHVTAVRNVGSAMVTEQGVNLWLRGSVVSSNTPDCEQVGGTLASDGFNVLGEGCPVRPTDFTTALPGIAALADNGGPTRTAQAQLRSPALDLTPCTDRSGGRVATDQRGRPRAMPCTAGAYEDAKASPVVVTAESAGDNCALGGFRLDTGDDQDRSGALEAVEIASTSYVCHGAAGAVGTSALVVTTTLPAGSAACPEGGTRFDAGLDADRDGTLDAEEITTTAQACTGRPGEEGATGIASLVRQTTVPAGDATCPAGGTRVEAGADTDRDGQLSAAEIVSTSHVCHGRAGHSALVTVTAIESGSAECPAGGQRISAGLDADGNGALTDAEIVSVSVTCNGTRGADGADGRDGADGADGNDGREALVRTAELAAGDASCPAGGTRLEAGLDANRDGTLQDDEVSTTRLVCHGTAGDGCRVQQHEDGSATITCADGSAVVKAAGGGCASAVGGVWALGVALAALRRRRGRSGR